MRHTTALLLIIISSCGTHETTKTASEAPATTASAPTSAPVSASTVPTAAVPVAAYAQALADLQSLPTCTAANNFQLVWVKDPGVFETCDGTQWFKIAIPAIAASTGTATAVPLPASEWQDPVTSNVFLIGPQAAIYADAALACALPWKIPTTAELVAAVDHGIATKIGNVVMWTSDVLGVNATNLHSYNVVNTSSATATAQAETSTAATICTK